jgi:hypothetical protein
MFSDIYKIQNKTITMRKILLNPLISGVMYRVSHYYMLYFTAEFTDIKLVNIVIWQLKYRKRRPLLDNGEITRLHGDGNTFPRQRTRTTIEELLETELSIQPAEIRSREREEIWTRELDATKSRAGNDVSRRGYCSDRLPSIG